MKGCPRVVVRGEQYCEVHTQDGEQKERERRKEWKERSLRNMDEKQRYDFYRSKAWRNMRELHLHREPLCRECKAAGQEIDHIIQLKEGGAALDDSNLQTLCRTCHNRKRQREGTQARAAKKIVPRGT